MSENESNNFVLYHQILDNIENQIHFIKSNLNLSPTIALINPKTYQQLMIWHKHIFAKQESLIHGLICPIKQKFGLLVVPVLYVDENKVIVVIPTEDLMK